MMKGLKPSLEYFAWDWARDWARLLVRCWGRHAAHEMARQGPRSQGLVLHPEREPPRRDWTREWRAGRAREWLSEWGETWVPNWSRDAVRHWAQLLARDWGLSGEPAWLEDFALAELQSSQGRSGTRTALAYMGGALEPRLALFQAACRVSLNPNGSKVVLQEALSRWEAVHGNPLWSALARHLARVATPHDRVLLDMLARHPDGREATLWGLRYLVRGDLVLRDGGVLTLDALCDELGLPHLPFLEEMPEELVSGEEVGSPDPASARKQGGPI
jgi:hypothetical protein